MTPSALRGTVVLLATPGALAGIDARLTRSGIRLVRLRSIEPRPIPPTRWLPRVRDGPAPDTVLVTSRAAVDAGVVPWRRSATPRAPRTEYWAAGPTSARALLRIGVRRVRRARSMGAAPIVRALGPRRRRSVIYFRSDLAGPALARRLRRDGHRVVDVVVYRIRDGPRFSDRARRAVLGADLLIVTSPSGLDGLARRLGRPGLNRIARSTRVVVLGARSRSAARALGFRRVSVAPSSDPERFTHHLLRELSHART